MTYSVKILLDSINTATGDRITTWELSYPRFVHAELMTHRKFSRNAASSRAIPIQKMIKQVIDDPVVPKWMGKNQAGMQANQELTGWRKVLATWLWLQLRWFAIAGAWTLWKIGLHKQIANRILEPWMFITIILTATEFKNWFKLRAHKDAQPEIRWVAEQMLEAYTASKPQELKFGEWHIPMLQPGENKTTDTSKMANLLKISVGRCARISYLTHDGRRDTKEDVALHDRLVQSGHWSPFEHQAIATVGSGDCGNFTGFKPYRKFFGNESGMN